MDVSVIVPTLNEEDYLGPCLNSIKNQKTGFVYEIIVSDGSSQDRTIEIAKEYTDNITLSRERGTAIQRNEGAKKARSDHLLFIDADTLLKPGYIEKAHTLFLEDPELLAFSTGFTFPERTPKLIFSEQVMNSYFTVRSQLGRATLPGFNINIRKNIFNELGGFANVPLEDIEISIQLRQMGKIKYFSDFHVTTSSRRLEKMGLLGATRYYLEMDFTRKNPNLKRILPYSDYISCRIKNSDIQKTFETAFKGRNKNITLDLKMGDYIKDKIVPLAKIKNLSPTQTLKDTLTTTFALADIGFKDKIEQIDADQAIQIMKNKIKSIKEKTKIKAK